MPLLTVRERNAGENDDLGHAGGLGPLQDRARERLAEHGRHELLADEHGHVEIWTRVQTVRVTWTPLLERRDRGNSLGSNVAGLRQFELGDEIVDRRETGEPVRGKPRNEHLARRGLVCNVKRGSLVKHAEHTRRSPG